ncbi:MAG: type and secretion system protein [Edaphobacter sp.]|nr:type and secretion system protein [Edaphobacter sp.]
MTAVPQPRASTIARRAATFALCCLPIPTFAQAPADKTPANKKTVETTDGTPTKHQTQAAEDAYLAGARLLDHDDLARAEIQFDKAAKLNPSNGDYAMAYSITHQRHITELVKESGKARLLGQNEKAETLLAEARLLDPQNNIVGPSVDPGGLPRAFHPTIEPWIREDPAIAGPVTLRPDSGPKSFHLHADEQDVIRQVLSNYGIAATFDESVPRQNIRFDLDDSPYQQAVPILLSMAHLFAVPLDPKSVLIAKDTPENRQRLEHQLQETIYIPGMTNEQMDEFGNVVRNVFDVKQLTVDKAAGTLVIRAPEATLTYVNLTLADLIDGGSEVMIDLKLYSVNKTNQRNIGAQLPQQIGLYNVNAAAQNLVASNQSLVNQAIAQGLIPAGSSNITIALALIASGLVQSTLLSSTVGFFGGGLTATGVTTNQNAAFNLALTASDTRALNDVQIRVGDRQPATFRIGQRYPITTATYSTASPAQTSALAGVSINGVSATSLLNAAVGSPITIPQIQYEDLGLTLKATPVVQRSGAIKMHLDLKIEALNGGSINSIPILNSQQFASDVTVDDGDTAVMVSSLTKNESASISGYPGLADLPGFQTATADKMTTTDSGELILLVTPHVTRRRANLTAGPRIAINLPEPSS